MDRKPLEKVSSMFFFLLLPATTTTRRRQPGQQEIVVSWRVIQFPHTQYRHFSSAFVTSWSASSFSSQVQQLRSTDRETGFYRIRVTKWSCFLFISQNIIFHRQWRHDSNRENVPQELQYNLAKWKEQRKCGRRQETTRKSHKGGTLSLCHWSFRISDELMGRPKNGRKNERQRLIWWF